MLYSLSKLNLYRGSLDNLPESKLLINTINAHSFNIAQKDPVFAESLIKSDILLPDGVSIVVAILLLTGEKVKKIAGADLFFYEMKRMNLNGGTCLFIGSNENTLRLIYERASREYPKIKVLTYSPPYKQEFSLEDNESMFSFVNECKPDVLFIGMTAPKQEKWAYQNFHRLVAVHICCIGAVFDFYAETVKRAPEWMIRIGLEWFYRLVKEPRRMWRRYFLGNFKFMWLILREKISNFFDF
jgi:N-acetylglucosaminyldiphosphoundecaprenol N-acetyl-beta-D-mannosaminyltransferase